MKKTSTTSAIPACGCKQHCRCQRALRCRCHDYNALLALTLWDYSRAVRRHLAR
jgi:hypothetical protein